MEACKPSSSKFKRIRSVRERDDDDDDDDDDEDDDCSDDDDDDDDDVTKIETECKQL